VWPFKRRRSAADVRDSEPSREQLLEMAREQARREGLSPPPDDVQFRVLRPMTGDEADKMVNDFRRSLGLPPDKRPGDSKGK
jgi:hypothetical protein